jgi:hypothetical protein
VFACFSCHFDEQETRAALDLIFSGILSPHEPGVLGPGRETLLTKDVLHAP